MASARGVRDRLEELLSERILVLDGAMGTAIQALELSEIAGILRHLAYG